MSHHAKDVPVCGSFGRLISWSESVYLRAAFSLYSNTGKNGLPIVCTDEQIRLYPPSIIPHNRLYPFLNGIHDGFKFNTYSDSSHSFIQ